MAFSFRVGSNWYHDFPKLARDSGFYFNAHRPQVRVDWNRISSIDIDRVIRERDFSVVEENINNVIDYCLESEYDTKILDSNFVKLFRIAQLAVEYLLYCKQYLDHSVIILKDELKSKIEENVKLKKDLTASEEIIKQLKEKAKEKKKLMESTIIQSNGEIHKCPYCPKTFMSTIFVAAHVMRRHPYISEFSATSSPVHEHYRAETEKLHNEIKALKERLNQTERVISNEPDRISESKRNKSEKKDMYDMDKNDTFYEQQTKYQAEIHALKNILFDEIRNLKEKNNSYKLHENTPDASMKSLVSQQEREIQRLKDQLQEKVALDIESVHLKLQMQENYWKSKLESLEHQHQMDIENLTSELKVTQQAANRMKHEYETKVDELERQSMNQSSMLTEQRKELNSLSRELTQTQMQNRNNENPADFVIQKFCESDKTDEKKSSDIIENGTIVIEDIDSTDSHDIMRDIEKSSKNKIPQATVSAFTYSRNITSSNYAKQILEPFRPKAKPQINHETETPKRFDNYSLIKRLRASQNLPQKLTSQQLNDTPVKSFEKYFNSETNKTISKSKDDKQKDNGLSNVVKEFTDSSGSESESSSVESDSESESTSRISENAKDNIGENKIFSMKADKKIQEVSVNNEENIREAFNKKLMDLGIDPEWEGIPRATFEQKMEIIKHHQNLNSKKFSKYNQLKSKLIEDLSNQICRKQKPKQIIKSSKSSIDKLVTNVKLKAAKAFNMHKETDVRRSILKPKDETPKKSPIINYDPSKKHIHTENAATQSPSVSLKKPDANKELNVDVKQAQPILDLHTNFKNRRHSMSCTDEEISLQKNTKGITSPRKELKLHRTNNYSSDEQSVSDAEYNKKIQFDRRKSIEELTMEEVALSPKSNKSVLKSSIGSVTNLTKKKVLFDLEGAEDHSLSLQDLESNGKEHNNSDWNISSFSSERSQVDHRKSSSADNIVLRTTQSEKIAQITKKIEEQLQISRQKPVGAIEAMFLPSRTQETEKQTGEKLQYSSDDLSISVSEQFMKEVPVVSKETNKIIPKPAPRIFREKESSHVSQQNQSSTKDSDLDLDIDEILQLT